MTRVSRSNEDMGVAIFPDEKRVLRAEDATNLSLSSVDIQEDPEQCQREVKVQNESSSNLNNLVDARARRASACNPRVAQNTKLALLG